MVSIDRSPSRSARSGWRSLLLVPLVLGLTVACSHTSSYARPDEELPPPAARGPLRYRILLVGDAGNAHAGDATLAAVRRWTATAAGRSLVVFLGDNAYPEGFKKSSKADAERTIASLLNAVGGTLKTTVFIPGNHDWAKGQTGGLAAVRAQQRFLQGRARFLPQDGCPGPVALDVPASRPVVRLIALDTQWWLHAHDKPSEDCGPGTPIGVVEAMKVALDTPLPVIVAAHHPLQTHGPHGGFHDWQDQVFPFVDEVPWLWLPLPGLGSLYHAADWRFRRKVQDINSDAYQSMVADLEEALLTHTSPAPLLYAAGHDHSLQVLSGRAVDYVIVSGSGSDDHTSAVSHGDDTLFAHQHSGFVSIDVESGAVRLSVVESDGPQDHTVFHVSMPLSTES